MLGKDHITLSVFTVSLLIMPFFTDYALLFILAVIAAGVGSLAPDSDSPDAAIFHDKIKGLKGNTANILNSLIGPILPIFGFIIKFLIYHPSIKAIQFLTKKDKLSLQYEVTEAHRGILHSNLGLAIAVVFLFIYGIILMLFFPDMLSLQAILIFTFAFSIGFFLHLIEDTCTVTGINFSFPFSKKLYFKGKIRTGKKDKYTKYTNSFGGYLGALNVGYFLAPSLAEKHVKLTLLHWELIIIVVVILSWAIFIKISGVKKHIGKSA